MAMASNKEGSEKAKVVKGCDPQDVNIETIID
jgi:hypothetical protein